VRATLERRNWWEIIGGLGGLARSIQGDCATEEDFSTAEIYVDCTRAC